MNNLTVYRRDDGKYDFRVTAAENGNTLCSSDQGYESKAEAQRIGVRVLTQGVGLVLFSDQP